MFGVQSRSWPAAAALAGAHLGHRVLQHLLVELDADLADMAGLLVAQQVAGAADVEVVRRQGEPGAQRIQRLHHRQPLLRRRPTAGGSAARSDRRSRAACRARPGRATGRAAPGRTCRRDGSPACSPPACRARFRRCWWTAGCRICRRRTRSSRVPARSAPAARAPAPCAPPARSRAAARPCAAGPRCAARRRTPGRRGSARAGSPRGSPPQSNGMMKVRTASRSTGGVAIRLISRTPVSASCKRARDRRRGQRQHMHVGLAAPSAVPCAPRRNAAPRRRPAGRARRTRSTSPAAHGCR